MLENVKINSKYELTHEPKNKVRVSTVGLGNMRKMDVTTNINVEAENSWGRSRVNLLQDK